MLNRGKDSDFVESILFLSVGKIEHLHFLESVLLPVLLPLNFVDLAVGAITYGVRKL
jgi:hypothetical protein